jgi:hypothetical protein
VNEGVYNNPPSGPSSSLGENFTSGGQLMLLKTGLWTSTRNISTRDRCYDFENIFATKLNYAKFWSYHCFLRKTPIFSVVNCQKSPKIVIITSTTDWCFESGRVNLESTTFFKFEWFQCGRNIHSALCTVLAHHGQTTSNVNFAHF